MITQVLFVSLLIEIFIFYYDIPLDFDHHPYI